MESETLIESLEGVPRPDLVSGNIPKAIFRLAWPAVAAMFMHAALNTTDAFWVGRLGPAAMAAVFASGFIVWLIISLGDMISVGLSALVARFFGAGDTKMANEVTRQGMAFGILFAAVLGAGGFSVSRLALGVVGVEADVQILGAGYMRICLLGLPFFFGLFMINSVLNGAGDTRTPMRLTLTSIVLNMGLDPLLILGFGPFPRLGVRGAALATVIAEGIAFGIGLWFVLRGRSGIHLAYGREFRIQARTIWRILRIGIPSSISWVIFSSVYVVITRFTALFGTPAVAALGVGTRLESFSYMTGWGFSVAAATLVGQNLGAHRPDRAQRATLTTAGIIVGITGVIAALFLLIPHRLVAVFNPDPDVVEMGASYLRIIAFAQILQAAGQIMGGAFRGAGDTVPPMVFTTVTALLRIPTAYLLAVAFGLGVEGLWMTISLAMTAHGLLMIAWFRWGKWRERKV